MVEGLSCVEPGVLWCKKLRDKKLELKIKEPDAAQPLQEVPSPTDSSSKTGSAVPHAGYGNVGNNII